MAEERGSDEKNASHENSSRWSSYGNYRMIMWVWMMNEVTVMFSPSELSHNGYYYHGLVQAFGVVFIGIPLVYSEIALAQYTNCDIISMWDFCPIFRPVGYASIFLIVLKILYLMVLVSWYLVYTFYSALDPPPWFSCDSFPDSKCMVKSINVSIFQHCLEALTLFGSDCGMQTASYCFYDREIGYNSTSGGGNCFFSWKAIIACTTISLLLFVLSIRKEKFMQVLVKILVIYLSIVMLCLFSVALSSSGTWYASTITLHWKLVFFSNTFNSLTRGLLSVGSGCGIIVFISHDVSFRSPATMTAIITSLFSLTVTLILSLIAFSGIKTMSYYHGEEEYVIEVDDGLYFTEFASMAEIMTYFGNYLWGFFWFSSIAFCLFANIWILHLYLGDLMFRYQATQRYKNLSCAVLLVCLSFITWPFFCSDLTGALTDATELIQIMNNLFFSIALYWIYGLKTHSVDIIFMIGIRPSYFWKIAWLLNPIILAFVLYFRFDDLQVRTYGDSYQIWFMPWTVDWMFLFFLLSTYAGIIIVGMVIQIIKSYRYGSLADVFLPTDCWGPRELVLFKSRKMFVPEIMTTEFLYRQVRIRGYSTKKKHGCKNSYEHRDTIESFDEEIEWSPLTSN